MSGLEAQSGGVLSGVGCTVAEGTRTCLLFRLLFKFLCPETQEQGVSVPKLAES